MSKSIMKKLAELGVDEPTSKEIVKLFHSEWKLRKQKIIESQHPKPPKSVARNEPILADSGSEAEYLRGHEI